MRLFDFFFALRPLVLVPAWSFFIVGAELAGRSGDHFPRMRLALLSLVLVSTYLINQVVDYESDRINGKGFFLQQGIFSRRLYVAAAVSGVALALAASMIGRHSPGLIATSAVLGMAYSLPPLRLVARPGLDLVANGAGYGCIAMLLGTGGNWVASGVWIMRLAAGFLAVAAVFLHTTLLDLEGDQRTGKRTAGVALGSTRARLVAAAAATAAAVSAAWSASLPWFVVCATLAAACVAGAAKPQRVSSRSICVGGTAAFALLAGMFQPWFLVVIVALTWMTRAYYRKRFALAYPSL